MVIVTLPQLVGAHDHDLWFLTETNSFGPNALACAASAYADYARIPARRRNSMAGSNRNSAIVALLEDMFERDYNGRAGVVRNQLRIVVQGLNSVFLDFLVRKARPVVGGFDTDKVGPMTEQASLMHLEALEFVPGHSCMRGIFMAYHESEDHPGYVEMWLVYEWRARAGSRFIECDKAAYLGMAPFGSVGGGGYVAPVQPVDRGTTGAQVELD